MVSLASLRPLFTSKLLRLFLLAFFLLVIPAALYALNSAPSPEEYDRLSGYFWSSGGVDRDSHALIGDAQGSVAGEDGGAGDRLRASTLTGGVVMGHLGNETAKAELGRASWKLLHLMTLRFPEEPTPDERTALKSYFYLFSRLYPCGECAAHFQDLLKEFPPQTSSRKSASLWLCHLHNLVNTRLMKPQFDCSTLDATYDCGCGPNPSVGASATSLEAGQVRATGTVVTGGEAASGAGAETVVDGKDALTGVEVIKGGRR